MGAKGINIDITIIVSYHVRVVGSIRRSPWKIGGGVEGLKAAGMRASTSTSTHVAILLQRACNMGVIGFEVLS